MMKHRTLLATAALTLPVGLAAWSAQADDLAATLQNSQQFSMFADALAKAGMVEDLQSDGTYTVFAPTNRAFQNLARGDGHRMEEQASSGQAGEQQQSAASQSSQAQGSRSQSNEQPQMASAQAGQTEASGSQAGQQSGTAPNRLVQQLDSKQLKQVLDQHIIEGTELLAKDLLGQEQKVKTRGGDELTIDGTGSMVVLVPTGLSIARVGDEVFVRREVAAATVPAVTVQPAGQQEQKSSQGEQQAQSSQQSQGEQQQAAHSGGSQQTSQQDQQQANAQGGGEAQSGQGDRPIAQQQGVLRAAMVVEPDIRADNGVIHAIDQVIVPQAIEQQLEEGEQQGQQQG